MPKKILSTLLGLLTLLASNASAFAEIPAGYALVPISALTSQNFGNPSSANTTISASNSALRADDEIGYLGENFRVTVTLRDTENQPVSNRTVNLIGSRATDSIRAVQATTDANGEALFSVNATKEGISSFTAIDQNSGTTINERPRVVFLKQTNGIGGSHLKADALVATTDTTIPATSAIAYEGKIVADFPASVTVNTPTDITVNITDLSGNIVTNFNGGVAFVTSDTDAILPKNYTFKEVDKGTHTFANAVTFRTAGSKSFTITSDNVAVAPLTIDVAIAGDIAETEKPVILSPTDGSTTNKTITLQGLAPANSNLAAFVNNQYYAQGSSDTSGNFDIDLELSDGEYSLTVGVVVGTDSVGSMSEAVSVTIDTAPPELTQIVLDPSEAATTEDDIYVIVQSESDLSEASVNINNKNIICSNEGDGFYQANVGKLPAGDYAIGVILKDATGNSAELDNAATLKIAALEAKEPIAIEKITTTPKSQRVDIVWEETDRQIEIDHYFIFYGVNPADLDQFFQTTDNSTAWYIGGLNNDTEYTFQIVALDAKGEANGYSEPFIATPTSQLGLTAASCDGKLKLNWKNPADQTFSSYQINYGLKSGEYAESRILPDGRDRQEWEIRDLINGAEYFITLRGVAANGNVVFDPQEEISATPILGACHGAAVKQPIQQQVEQSIQLQIREDENGKTILMWNPVDGAIGYKVYAGTTPNLFDLPTVTVATPYLRPEGLMANEDYYFAVRAVYADHEAAALSNVTKVEVGPAAFLAVASIVAIIGGYWLKRRRQPRWVRID